MSVSGCCEGRQCLGLPFPLHTGIGRLVRRDDIFDLKKMYFFVVFLLVNCELGFGSEQSIVRQRSLGNDLRHGEGSRTVSLDSLAGIVSRIWELLKLSTRGMLAIGKKQKQW